MGDAIKVEGLEKVQRAIADATKRYTAGLNSALYRLGVEIARSAAMRAPSVSGALRESVYATAPSSSGEVEVGFGAPYAAKEHEDTALEHRHGGQGHFLQNAVAEQLGGGLSRLAQWTNEAAQGAVPSSQGISERPKFNGSRSTGSVRDLLTRSNK